VVALTPMETSQAIKDAAENLRSAKRFEKRLEIFTEAARQLNAEESDQYELDATCLAVARGDTAEFARSVLTSPEQADEGTRFLIFAAGAIACRRAEDKQAGEELLDLVRNQFAQVPLFKHFDALALEGGSKRQLRRGLALEREFLKEGGGRIHAGGGHLIARFILQLSECDETIGEAEFEEALDSVNEAIDSRSDYAKFFATRAAVYTHLGRFDDARNDLVKAIRLEDRSSVDARERIAEYKFERRTIEMHRTLRSVTEQAKSLEARSKKTADRLRGAELSAISAVAFIAAILSLIQITLDNVDNRPLGESLVIVGSFAVILFGAVAFGSWLLRRPWSSLADTASSESSTDID
jgi:tetratricopeptide (TPR) repeat protein